jgi:hypothetical protein
MPLTGSEYHLFIHYYQRSYTDDLEKQGKHGGYQSHRAGKTILK